MLAHLDRAFDSAKRTARGEQGRISVGYGSGAGFHPLVQRVIREFRDAFPLVFMTLAEDLPYGLSERLRNDQIDVAFIRTSVPNVEGLVIEPLREEEIVVALPSRHALARSKISGDTALPLKALADETFVVYGDPQGTLTLQTNAVMARCEASGFSPRVGYVVPHHLSTLNLVAAGFGVSFVAASVRRMHIEGVVFRRLKGMSQMKVPLNLVSRRGDASAVVRQFRILAKRTAKTLRMIQ